MPYQDAPLYLALGDVAAAPKLSLTEGAGKLLNYMAVGLPTVAFDTPVAREYLGDEGVFAAPGEAASLAARLLEVLAAAVEARRGLGERLRQRAMQHFSWAAAGQVIAEAYRQLV